MPSGNGSNPYYLIRSQKQEGPRTIIAGSRMAFCGSIGREHRGGIYLSGMDPGARSRADSTGGARRGCGMDCWLPFSNRPMPPAISIGSCITWTAPSSEPISMRPGQKGGSSAGSSRAQLRGIQHQDSPPSGGTRQAADGRDDAGAAPGSCGVYSGAG